MTDSLKLHPEDPLVERLAGTVFIVEANSFEKLCLWKEWKDRLPWREDLSGNLVTIGHVQGRPIVVSLFWANLNGQKVMFTELTSQLADYKLLDAWLDANCAPRYDSGLRSARCNAMNFHLCAHAVLEAQQSTAVPE